MTKDEYRSLKGQMGAYHARGREAHRRRDFAKRNELFNKHDEIALLLWRERAKRL